MTDDSGTMTIKEWFDYTYGFKRIHEGIVNGKNRRSVIVANETEIRSQEDSGEIEAAASGSRGFIEQLASIHQTLNGDFLLAPLADKQVNGEPVIGGRFHHVDGSFHDLFFSTRTFLTVKARVQVPTKRKKKLIREDIISDYFLFDGIQIPGTVSTRVYYEDSPDIENTHRFRVGIRLEKIDPATLGFP